ncbi:MAG: hypothetical protein UY72_C0049G0001, partial [Candidatus Uhrbacteria bacterium GW2011_GWD2_52_7]
MARGAKVDWLSVSFWQADGEVFSRLGEAELLEVEVHAEADAFARHHEDAGARH